MQSEIELENIKFAFDTSGMSTAEILNLANTIRVLDRKMGEIARKAYQDEIESLKARLEDAEKCLKFYAEKKYWSEVGHPSEWYIIESEDRGKRAREYFGKCGEEK